MKKLLLLITLFTISVNAQTIALQQFATGFSNAIAIAHPPNDTRLFIVQQRGLIRILNANGTVNATPFINLASVVSQSGGERGLLGLAFHPNYATNGLFFVNYTDTATGNTIIARYSVSANPDIANATGTILMNINQPYSNHNGGSLVFGPDGYLYIALGDGGSGGDPQGYSQNLSLTNSNVTANPSRIYLGKMLRIDVDTTAGALNYGFPPTNPFISEAGKQEIWARGLRNPWKFSFNRLNGDLWIGDVGQGAFEEINKVAAPLPNTGLNFGWKCYEGNATYNTSGCAAQNTMTMPVSVYPYNGQTEPCTSVTGGYFYTGSLYPNLQNKYIFADYCWGDIGYVSNTGGTITWSYNSSSFITSFGEGIDGELYVSTGSTIHRLVDTSQLNLTDFDKTVFTIYPNPTRDFFTIKNLTDSQATQLDIIDLTGKILLSRQLENSTENTIYTNQLSKGIYLISVQADNGNNYTTKLIVK
jgi:glucose/arabinose dehydrogenase